MITVGNSDFNGDALLELYLVFDVGNQAVNKGAANVQVGIAQKRALPNLSQTDDPIGDYTTGVPADTVTTTYAERSLEPVPKTVMERFLPEDMQDVWDKWQPTGDFTNLMQNAEFLRDVLRLTRNKLGTQLGRNFWQGDTGGSLPDNLFNGIITRTAADG